MLNNFSDDRIKYRVEEYPIKGSMFSVECTVTDVEIMRMLHEPEIKEYMKEKMADKLLRSMLGSNYISFTKIENTNFTSTIYARGFLVPNDQVQILRSMKLS